MEPIESEGERTTVEVTINASGMWVHGERVTAVERTEPFTFIIKRAIGRSGFQ